MNLTMMMPVISSGKRSALIVDQHSRNFSISSSGSSPRTLGDDDNDDYDVDDDDDDHNGENNDNHCYDDDDDFEERLMASRSREVNNHWKPFYLNCNVCDQR